MSEAPAYQKPVPAPSAVSAPFWGGLRQRELRLQKCEACSRFVLYPRSVCPYCLSDKLSWVKASGRGKLYTYTVVRRAMNPAFQEDVPYLFAIVELEEGVRLTTNVVNCAPQEARVDMALKAFYHDITPEITLLKFEPT